MSKKFYLAGAVSMLGMAILVPLILQEPVSAVSGENPGVPAVSGRLNSTLGPDGATDARPDEARTGEPDAAPPLPPTEAMTMSVGAKHGESGAASGQTDASSGMPSAVNREANPAPEASSAMEKGGTPFSVEKNAPEAEHFVLPSLRDSGGADDALPENTPAASGKPENAVERKQGVREEAPKTSQQTFQKTPQKTSSGVSDRSPSAVKPGTLVTRSSLPAQAGKQVVTSSTLTMDGDVITLRLEANSALKGKAFILASPDRVVLDLSGDWKLTAPRVPSNRMLRELRVGAREEGTRLVFDMKVKPNKATLKQVGSRILELRIR